MTCSAEVSRIVQSIIPPKVMNTVDMHKLQMFSALAPPPGLEAAKPARRVSFAADAKAPPEVPRKVFLADAEESPEAPAAEADVKVLQQQVPESQPRTVSAGFFCVHCGAKIPAHLVNAGKFCVHCGVQHPESVLESALNAAKTSTPPSADSATTTPPGLLLKNIDNLRMEQAWKLAYASWQHVQDSPWNGAGHFGYQPAWGEKWQESA